MNFGKRPRRFGPSASGTGRAGVSGASASSSRSRVVEYVANAFGSVGDHGQLFLTMIAFDELSMKKAPKTLHRVQYFGQGPREHARLQKTG